MPLPPFKTAQFFIKLLHITISQVKVNSIIQSMVTGMPLRVSELTSYQRLSYLGVIVLGSVKTNKGLEILDHVEVLLATS